MTDLMLPMTDGDNYAIDEADRLTPVQFSNGWAIWDYYDSTGDGEADDRYITRLLTKEACLAEIGVRALMARSGPMSDELKPCPNPWCAGDAILVTPEFADTNNGSVMCTNCGNTAPDFAHWRDAITAWDTRAPSVVKPLAWIRIGSRLQTASAFGLIYSVVSDDEEFTTIVAGVELYKGDDPQAAEQAAQEDIYTRIQGELVEGPSDTAHISTSEAAEIERLKEALHCCAEYSLGPQGTMRQVHPTILGYSWESLLGEITATPCPNFDHEG